MDSLEAVLRKVADLGRDMSAEIVVQEEISHEEAIPGSDRGSGPCSFDKVWDYEYIIDKPRITEPDAQKREAAEQKLQQIYDSSEWYSARYVAGIALSVDAQNLGRILNEGLLELKIQLKSKKNSGRTKSVAVGSHDEEDTSLAPLPSCDRHAGPDTVYRAITDYEERSIFVPDTKMRLKGLADAKKLYQLTNSVAVKGLLEESYKNNESKEVRGSAGQALGHSGARIWVNEHPVGAGAAVIGATGAAAAMVYTLVQYLSK